MKMPNSVQMSREQKKIYEEAPTDGVVFIGGPPGTGKTVIAFLRANTIVAKRKDATVIMYNNVLKQYSKGAADEEAQVETANRWFWSWWTESGPS